MVILYSFSISLNIVLSYLRKAAKNFSYFWLIDVVNNRPEILIWCQRWISKGQALLKKLKNKFTLIKWKKKIIFTFIYLILREIFVILSDLCIWPRAVTNRIIFLRKTEITVVRDGFCTANSSEIFVHYHFDNDLIEFKMLT